MPSLYQVSSMSSLTSCRLSRCYRFLSLSLTQTLSLRNRRMKHLLADGSSFRKAPSASFQKLVSQRVQYLRRVCNVIFPLLSFLTRRTGISNLRAVQDVMNAQSLEYIFPYSRFAFDTDINILTLSQGRKSTFFQVRTSKVFSKNILIIHL